jgi:transcription initiation factor IIE alpha subunit
MSPFEFANQILQGKKQLIVDESTEDEYVPFMVNRALSYHKDCVLYANEMNRRHQLDKKLQNDYLLNTIRAKKRPFNKWIKPEKSEDIACIKSFYGFSDAKARDALRLLTDKQIQELKEKADKGGLGK